MAIRLIFGLMLLVFGGLILWAGCDAVRQQHYEMQWRVHSTVGSSHSVDIYDGPDAIRFGIGLICFGTMLAVWGLCVGVAFNRKESSAHVGSLAIAFGWFSMLCLLSASVCVFPPWRLSSAPFYAVAALVLIFLFALPNSTSKRWARYFFLGIICVTILVASFSVGASTGMIFGILASFGILRTCCSSFQDSARNYCLQTVELFHAPPPSSTTCSGSRRGRR